MRPSFQLILLVCFLFICEENKIGESSVCPDTRCTCSHADKENITAVCRMSDLENVSQSFSAPSKVNLLDLSHNEIKAMKQNTFQNFSGLLSLTISRNRLEELLPNSFTGLKNLLKLSLTYNNIRVIHKDAFSGLYSLQILNLTSNKLQIWNAHGASLHLVSLRIVDVQANMGWRPEDKYLLELPRLKEIRNVSWADECLDCWLIRNVSEEEIIAVNSSRFNRTSIITCIRYHFTFSHYFTLLARHRFLVRKCRSLRDCIFQQEANVTKTYPCWTTNQRVISVQVLLGTLGGCLNLVVVFNILLTRSLRKNVSMVLVSNLAMGDTLICLFSAAMASVVVSIQRQNIQDLTDILCPKVGFLWVLGQSTSSITSVALTLERYLCIVFALKPEIRMTPRLASLAIAFNWVTAISFMSIAQYFKIYRRNFLCIPIIWDSSLPIETGYGIALGSIGITLYLLTIPMHIHIYMVVKRSSQQMGVQRESTLAKRIAILVGTNLVFFFIPILLLGVWRVLVSDRQQMLLSIYFRRLISEWIPLYCLCINSCLNPLVHAFRNNKFKNALKRKIPLRCNTSNVTPST